MRAPLALVSAWFVPASCLCAIASDASAEARTPAHAGATDLRRGTVIELVTCVEAPEQSYALYLPSQYTPERVWPILYAFDPRARGTVPVRLAVEAAERFGWIVVGSNNSRNASAEGSVAAANAMLRDTRARFSVDPRRAYAAGFSGGARVAAGFAQGCPGCFAGVIAHGAGFPDGTADAAARWSGAWFGVAGETDFNYAELVTVHDALERHGKTHRLRVFAGAHEWGPSEVWVEALRWLELVAMRDGLRDRDDGLQAAALAAAGARVSEIEAGGDLLALGRELRALARDFAERPEGLAAARRAQELVASEAYEQALKLERSALDEQERLTNRFYAGLHALVAGTEGEPLRSAAASDDGAGGSPDERPSPIDVRQRLRRDAMDLRQRLAREKKAERRRVFERALSGLYVGMLERGQGALREKQSEMALTVFDLASLLRPEANGPHLQCARAHALARRKGDVVKDLERALERGLDRPALARFVETTEELAALREEPAIRALLAEPAAAR